MKGFRVGDSVKVVASVVKQSWKPADRMHQESEKSYISSFIGTAGRIVGFSGHYDYPWIVKVPALFGHDDHSEVRFSGDELEIVPNE